MQSIKVHREILYKEVWAEPMSKLAVRYNVSDVALAKVCRKLQVPIPPRGYWARIQHGQQITIPKLPKLLNGEVEETILSPVLLRTRALSEAVVEQKAFEADPAHQIAIDPKRELHPLVRKTRSILSGRLPNKEPSLDVHVSKTSHDRALHLLSAILYAFEERGFKIEVRSDSGDKSFVIINDEPLQFSLCEEAKKIDAKLKMNTDGQAEAGTRMIFRIHDFWASGYRKTWADRAKRPLEDQLNDMMPALVELATVIRKERLERERRNAAIDEEIRQRNLERARRQQMEPDLGNWRVAAELRALVAQVLHQASKEGVGHTPGVIRWIEWANWVASENDPLNNGVASFVERYKF